MLASISQALWARSGQLLTSVFRNAGVMQLQQQRGVVVVRRLFPPPIPKLGRSGLRKPKRSSRVYILEEDTTHRPREKLRLILTDDIPKIGNRGEVVLVDKRVGRNKLIPSGLAVYASPENLKEFALSKQKERDEAKEETRLSPMAIKTIEYLKRNRLEVRMHAESEWDNVRIEHVIHAFKHRLGVVVPEHALTLPELPITECGTYSIAVTVNGMENIPMEMDVINYLPKRRATASAETETNQEEEETR